MNNIIHYYRVTHSNHCMTYKCIYTQMLCINIVLFTLYISGKYPSSGVITNRTYITAQMFFTSLLYKGVDNQDKWHLI
jgi:hypothetical protein